ncbi:MAG TPA: alpha/beta fold hydrolase [Casimicrobiaceae bacterium]|nr:alpha/beta fold hydrolase [Casimicrobiaceae bacterium]
MARRRAAVPAPSAAAAPGMMAALPPALPAPVAPPPAPRAFSVAPPDPSFVRDSFAATAFADTIDRSAHALTARFTAGLSPIALAKAYGDWAAHLAFLPGKQMRLGEKAAKKAMRFALYAARKAVQQDTPPCIEPLPQDHRFDGEAWRGPPFDFYWQSFLLVQQWWHNATTGVRGVTRQDENIVAFATRQVLDLYSPSNHFLTNPEVLARTMAEGGLNLWRGAHNLAEDWARQLGGGKPVGSEAFVVGRDVAVTPGKVVFRNRLIELIQYAPATGQVRPEPVLVVPAWIMKYYILDLSPRNSLVRYLVSQGFTVFMISWKNPAPEDRDLAFDDYRTLGMMAALDAVTRLVPHRKVHGVGYCLGGTLLAIGAAAMARERDDRLATTSYFAAQVDFSEAGELTLFINESQLTFLEDTMWEQGFLDSRQMHGAFQLLRSNDLVWSRGVRDYLMGERTPMTDLLAWNADATRMPFRMHTEYLRRLFLDNDLAEGRYHAGGAPVALADLTKPTFALGTETDHVAPWRSVYKLHLLTNAPMTFVLTNGGHNAGIVSPPEHPRRRYRIMSQEANGRFEDPDAWMQRAPVHEGSWWPAWTQWLARHSGRPVAPPHIAAATDAGKPLADAPGSYVLEP